MFNINSIFRISASPIPTNSIMSKEITVLGVNGGNGVILHQFLRKPFKLLGNIENRSLFKTPENIQWKANFKEIPLEKTLNAKFIIGVKPDVIIGAPDCGHSSILSYSRAKKKGNAKENASLTMFLKSIGVLRPKIFIMENLSALLEQYTEEDFKKGFPKYRFIFLHGSVGHFGNSQLTRKRLLVIGIKKRYYKEVKKYFKLPKLDKSKLKYSGELIGDLMRQYPRPTLCHVREINNTIITLYAGKKMKLSDIQERWITELAFKKRWPVEDRNFKNAPGVYKNLESDYPSTARKQNRQFNHAGQMMSPRELGRIQGVPDFFNLVFLPSNPQYWINKGRVSVTKCPPYEVGTWAYHSLKKAFNTINHDN